MEIGLRIHKSASLRVAVPESLPEHMQPHMRELVSVASDERGRGHASALMHRICQEADDACVTLLVQVKAFAEGMTDEQLQRFYSKFGFIVIQTEPVVLMARQVVPNRLVRMH